MNRVFVVLVCCWTLALPAAALLSHERSLPAVVFVDAVYTGGRVVCHQRPERSFVLAGTTLPVCARCTGLYVGAAVSAIAVVGWRRRPSAAGNVAARARLALGLAAVPILLTLLAEWITGDVPSGLVRACSAAPFGAAVAWAVLRATRNGAQVGVN